MSVLITPGSSPPPLLRSDVKHYAIVGKRRMTDAPKLFMIEFGIYNHPNDALNAVARRVRGDLTFQKKYRGWQFCACRVDQYLEIADNGTIIVRYRDQEGDW